ncbi:MAG: hypothetical protein LZF60_160113 [Nitrospira sp.]|nr:MAG: hypothetical protein LZF60_160113 [Nitrospira sp.]
MDSAASDICRRGRAHVVRTFPRGSSRRRKNCPASCHDGNYGDYCGLVKVDLRLAPEAACDGTVVLGTHLGEPGPRDRSATAVLFGVKQSPLDSTADTGIALTPLSGLC